MAEDLDRGVTVTAYRPVQYRLEPEGGTGDTPRIVIRPGYGGSGAAYHSTTVDITGWAVALPGGERNRVLAHGALPTVGEARKSSSLLGSLAPHTRRHCGKSMGVVVSNRLKTP